MDPSESNEGTEMLSIYRKTYLTMGALVGLISVAAAPRKW